jgi:hypothetical protein
MLILGLCRLGSDQTVNLITFSKKGTEIAGTFKCNYLPECRFTGVKVQSRPNDGYVDPEAQWVNHSQANYDYARRARWGGGGWR